MNLSHQVVIEEKFILKYKGKLKTVLKSALDLIGNTPIIKLHKIVPENAAEVWLKYEAVNPTGSYKDRMAK